MHLPNLAQSGRVIQQSVQLNDVGGPHKDMLFYTTKHSDSARGIQPKMRGTLYYAKMQNRRT